MLRELEPQTPEMSLLPASVPGAQGGMPVRDARHPWGVEGVGLLPGSAVWERSQRGARRLAMQSFW